MVVYSGGMAELTARQSLQSLPGGGAWLAQSAEYRTFDLTVVNKILNKPQSLPGGPDISKLDFMTKLSLMTSLRVAKANLTHQKSLSSLPGDTYFFTFFRLFQVKALTSSLQQRVSSHTLKIIPKMQTEPTWRRNAYFFFCGRSY